MEAQAQVMLTPVRPPRILVCPPAPRRKRVVDTRRPSFFEPKTLFSANVFDDDDLLHIKIRMVKNYLTHFDSGTFTHDETTSEKVVQALKCKCERKSSDTCVYSK